jgi:hypothetical protein
MASLLEQNPWLRDAKTRAKSMRLAAASSSAVEGIRKPFAEKTHKRIKAAPAKKK